LIVQLSICLDPKTTKYLAYVVQYSDSPLAGSKKPIRHNPWKRPKCGCFQHIAVKSRLARTVSSVLTDLMWTRPFHIQPEASRLPGQRILIQMSNSILGKPLRKANGVICSMSEVIQRRVPFWTRPVPFVLGCFQLPLCGSNQRNQAVAGDGQLNCPARPSQPQWDGPTRPPQLRCALRVTTSRNRRSISPPRPWPAGICCGHPVGLDPPAASRIKLGALPSGGIAPTASPDSRQKRFDLS
jgi:hypothetical protein